MTNKPVRIVDASPTVQGLVAALKTARATAAAEKKKEEILRKALLEEIGDGPCALFGPSGQIATVTVAQRTSIDTEALRKDYPDIAETYQRTTTVTTVSTGRSK